ncbi:hypothetical protein HDV00_000838, partial [Rhizophlyctis rosea]
ALLPRGPSRQPDPDGRAAFSAYDPPVRGERVKTKHKHAPDKIGGRSWEDKEEEAEIGSARWCAMMAERRRKEAEPSARPDAPALRKQRVEGETRKWTPQIPVLRSMKRDRRRPTATLIVQIPVGRRNQYLRPKPPMRKLIRRPADAVGPARGGDQVVQLPEIPEEHRRVRSIPVPEKRPENGNAAQVGTGSQSQVASTNGGNGSSGRRNMTPPVQEERTGDTGSQDGVGVKNLGSTRVDGNDGNWSSGRRVMTPPVREEHTGTRVQEQEVRRDGQNDGVENSGGQEGNGSSGRTDMTPPVQEGRTENTGSQSVHVGQQVAGNTKGNAVSADHVTAPTIGVAETAQNNGRNTPPGFRALSSADPPRPPPVQPI